MSILGKIRDKIKLKNMWIHAILIFVSILSIFPFIWLLSTSLKGAGENIFAYPPTIVPKDFTFANYIGSLSFAIPFCISKETKNDVNYGRNCGFKQK